MSSPRPEPNRRIELIDALRGSALAGILLLHSVEHWDFFHPLERAADWTQRLDANTQNAAFFLFGGKAYAVFALVFGVSFSLILETWSRRGLSFRGRFLWRLLLLAGFGYLHGLIYCGDILLVIAALGVPLVFLHRLRTRMLVGVAVLLLLQLPSWWQVGRMALDPGYQVATPRYWAVYGRLFEIYAQGSFGDVLRANLLAGQSARLWWTIETVRYPQMLGLFVCGLLLGRSRVFQDPVTSLRLARHCLAWGAIAFVVLYPLRAYVAGLALPDLNRSAVDQLVGAYFNLAQAALWVGGFIWLYRWSRARRLLDVLAPFGRMSLTCYVLQGLIGVPLFYGFGLAWYRWAGPFYSILIGLGILGLELAFARIWMTRFVYGPLEWLWRSLTLLRLDVPMRRGTSTTAGREARELTRAG